jgi:hypothetical protein
MDKHFLEQCEPVITVGMPRSGSTMLSRLLNESPKHYVLNDLYALQMIDATNAWNGFSNREAQLTFLAHLTKVIVNRSGLGLAPWIGKCSRLTQAQLDAVLERIAPPNVPFGNWAFTIAFVMQQIGDESGQISWGWNTPQDHHHLEKIKSAFPRAKIIFLARDPSLVALSYKNQSQREAAERYHIVAQSLAWKKAISNYSIAKEKYQDSVLLMLYEDIVGRTKEAIKSVNEFLGADIPTDFNLGAIGTNSSYAHQDRNSRQSLTPMECWLADLVLFRERSSVGYDRDHAPFSFSGLPELIANTMRFSKLYSTSMMRSRDTRKRVLRLLRG